jgi:hypothetical protein
MHLLVLRPSPSAPSEFHDSLSLRYQSSSPTLSLPLVTPPPSRIPALLTSPLHRYEPLFNTLRTVQQLGYSVGCSGRSTHGTLGLLVHVTSATHAPEHIEAAVLAFVEGFVETLDTMTEKEYARQVSGQGGGRRVDRSGTHARRASAHVCVEWGE